MIDFTAVLNNKPREADFVPATRNNLLALKSRLAEYDADLDSMVSLAGSLEVVHDQANIQAVEMAGQSKKLWRRIEDLRKHYVKEPNEFIKAVNSLAKSYQDRLVMIETSLKKKISAYQAMVELERRRQEEAERKARDELQAKVIAEAEVLGVEAPVVAPAVVPETPRVVRTEAGSASQRKEWKFEVIDASQVPREYLMIDEKAIRAAVKAGIRDIPGVRIYEETITVLRT